MEWHELPTYLFVNGLDELDRREDPYNLLGLLAELGSHHQIAKICVSSRVEQAFKLGLGDALRLALSQLTGDDIQHTAEEVLTRFLSESFMIRQRVDRTVLVGKLIAKANGVFLWLRVALKSSKLGLTGDEDKQKLLRRLDGLPTDLDTLYRSMWSRLSDDASIYERDAANYFRLMLAWDDEKYQGLLGPLTTFHMLVMYDFTCADLISKGRDATLRSEKVAKSLQKMHNQLELRCGGLLELTRLEEADKHLDRILSNDGLHSYKIDWIHRTALDFLIVSK